MRSLFCQSLAVVCCAPYRKPQDRFGNYFDSWGVFILFASNFFSSFPLVSCVCVDSRLSVSCLLCFFTRFSIFVFFRRTSLDLCGFELQVWPVLHAGVCHPQLLTVKQPWWHVNIRKKSSGIFQTALAHTQHVLTAHSIVEWGSNCLDKDNIAIFSQHCERGIQKWLPFWLDFTVVRRDPTER